MTEIKEIRIKKLNEEKCQVSFYVKNNGEVKSFKQSVRINDADFRLDYLIQSVLLSGIYFGVEQIETVEAVKQIIKVLWGKK